MPRLTRIVVWPTSGKPSTPWEDTDEADSFNRTSRRVSEAFREALEQEDVRARDTSIELFLDGEGGDGSDEAGGEVVSAEIVVRVVEHGVTEGAESGSITVSRGFHTLDAYTRAFYVADVLQAAARRLGTVHGWDVAAIDRAMDRVRENDYEYRWQGAWHANDEETLAVRSRARLLDDGFGRVSFDLMRAGETEPFATTPEVVIGTRRGDFRKLARSTRWLDAATLRLRLGKRSFTVDASTGSIALGQPPVVPRPNTATPDPSLPLPRLVVEDPPPISFTIGGGPTDRVPPEYVEELDRLFDHMATELEWVAWWLLAKIPVVELEYWLESKSVSLTVTVEGDVLSAVIVRPRKSIKEGDNGVAMARVDVLGLVEEVRRRTGLGASPSLPI